MLARIGTGPVLTALALVGILFLSVAHAGENDSEATGDSRTPSQSASSERLPLTRKGWAFELSPGDDVFPRYLADPRRSSFTVTQTGVSNSRLDAGSSRFGLRVGGRYGFLRFSPSAAPQHRFQIDLEGGFIGQFDQDNSTDNIGWDGIYGVQLAWEGPRGPALRFGMFHDSSHVGDEYAERTGRTRLDYTREELLLGANWATGERFRTYVETGYAHGRLNEELQEPWRVQTGVEFNRPGVLLRQRVGLYAATDISSFEESDWDLNVTVQGGVIVHVTELGRAYRFGVEYYRGRSPLGEFFLYRESYLSLGIWFDL